MPIFETTAAGLILWATIGYGLGSIPFGMVLARLMGLGNLREIGSGNIGATNVLRTGNKTAAALTLLLDGGKGAVAVLLARHFAPGEDAVQFAAFAAFIGHCYPIWLGFRGGKGMATFIGVWLALVWPVGLACCATWLVAVTVSRMSSMGALVSAAASTVWAIFFGYGSVVLLAVILTIMIYWRHSENIKRIRTGTEPKIGQKT